MAKNNRRQGLLEHINQKRAKDHSGKPPLNPHIHLYKNPLGVLLIVPIDILHPLEPAPL